jgi:DNA-binding MltR family transcriptional regulator
MSNEDQNPKITREAYEKVRAELQSVMDQLADQLPNEAGARMKELMSFRTSIAGETDRGAVLMAAAFLDDKLKELIEKRVVQDKKIRRRVFDFNGPLGTFSSRIDFAYLIGVIPKNAQRDLHTIRAIRNQFAHHAAPLSYDQEKVKALCDRLVFHGVKEVASGGSKFRRSVMALLTYIALAIESTEHIQAAADYAIPDRTDAYKYVSTIFSGITGVEYPLKHEHE